MSGKKNRDNTKLRNKRVVKEPKVDLGRFAGSSDEEDHKGPHNLSSKRKASSGPPVIQGKRAAKRARQKLVKQKLREEEAAAALKRKEECKTKASPATGWQLSGGVVAKDIKVGKGLPAKPGCLVSITYEGSLPGKDGDKEVFDSNLNPDRPLKFTIGDKQVVEGMEVGVAGMKVGGTRTITIPPKMGYGDDGSPPEIPGGATLVFQVDLVSFEKKSA